MEICRGLVFVSGVSRSVFTCKWSLAGPFCSIMFRVVDVEGSRIDGRFGKFYTFVTEFEQNNVGDVDR